KCPNRHQTVFPDADMPLDRDQPPVDWGPNLRRPLGADLQQLVRLGFGYESELRATYRRRSLATSTSGPQGSSSLARRDAPPRAGQLALRAVLPTYKVQKAVS